jgi:hypothetical protein
LSAIRTGRLYPPPPARSAAGSIKSMKNPNYHIGNRTCDLTACTTALFTEGFLRALPSKLWNNITDYSRTASFHTHTHSHILYLLIIFPLDVIQYKLQIPSLNTQSINMINQQTSARTQVYFPYCLCCHLPSSFCILCWDTTLVYIFFVSVTVSSFW